MAGTTVLPNFVDQTDGDIAIQVYVNSITLASVVAQLVILVTFIPDMAVFPTSLKFLSVLTIVSSMLSALVVFISGNFSCNPAIQVGCTLYMVGNIGKWCTYSLRLWLLAFRKNFGVMFCVGLLIVAHVATHQWWCAISPGERVLPRLCSGPITAEPLQWTELVASTTGAVVNLVFIVLHVFYLWTYFRDAISGKFNTTSTIIASPNRFSATLRLFSSSILVMLIDFIQWSIRKFFVSDTLHFFILIWGAQIISDIIYCSYMRVFANDLHREAQLATQPMVQEAYGVRRPISPGAQPGAEIDYISLEPVTSGKTTSSPVLSEMPLPIAAAKGRPGHASRGSWDRTL